MGAQKNHEKRDEPVSMGNTTKVQRCYRQQRLGYRATNYKGEGIVVGLQRYVSSELTHFVGRRLRTDDDRYALLIHIATSGRLTSTPDRPPMRWGLRISFEDSISENLMVLPNMVCFCDIPVEDFVIHMRKYGRFGIAFEKPFLIARGANPVWYIARNSITEHRGGRPNPAVTDPFSRDPMPRHRYYDLATRRFQRFAPDGLSLDQDNELAELHAFLEAEIYLFMKFFDDTQPEEAEGNYYMEREWRVIGDVAFELDDVKRLILPERYVRRLRGDIPAYSGQVAFAPNL